MIFFQILKEFELIREVTEEDIEGYVEKTRMLLTNLFENSDAMTEVTSSISVECKPPACREHGLHEIWRDVDILLWPWCDLDLDVWPWPY